MATASALPNFMDHRPLTPRLRHDAARTRTQRVVMLLVAVAILNGIDLLYTLFADRINMLYEANPLTAAYFQVGLVGSLISFKVLMVLCGLGILWKLRSCRLTVPACWMLLFAYAYLGVVWYRWVCVINYTFETRLAGGAP